MKIAEVAGIKKIGLDKKGKLYLVPLKQEGDTSTPDTNRKRNSYVFHRRHWKALEEHSREQYALAVASGVDPLYVLKSLKHEEEPRFEWSKGNLVFVGKKAKVTK